MGVLGIKISVMQVISIIGRLLKKENMHSIINLLILDEFKKKALMSKRVKW